jgi:hypothetical protein
VRHVFPEQMGGRSLGLILAKKRLGFQGGRLSTFDLPQGAPPLILEYCLRADSNRDTFTLRLLNFQSFTDAFYAPAKLLSESHLLLC